MILNEEQIMLSTNRKINQLIALSGNKKRKNLKNVSAEQKLETCSGVSKESFQLKSFQNGDVPIAYKENFVDGKPAPTDVTYKIMSKREQTLRPNKSSSILEDGYLVREDKNYQGLSLEKSPAGKWFIKDNMNNQLFEPEAGVPYIFVTMPSGKIRVSTRGKDGHVSLSGTARYVKYAGEVVFDKDQKIASWNNASYSYFPAPFLAFQANFQEGAHRFHKRVDRNDPVSQIAPIFSALTLKK
jgi:hypothetical protein